MQAEPLVDLHLLGLRLGRLADMLRTPVGTAKGSGDAHLAGEGLT